MIEMTLIKLSFIRYSKKQTRRQQQSCSWQKTGGKRRQRTGIVANRG
jgi:hypothetical protein